MATDGLRGSSGALAEVVPRSAGILGGRRRDRRGRGAGPAKKSAGAVRVREVTYGADEHARPSRPLAGSVAAGRWPLAGGRAHPVRRRSGRAKDGRGSRRTTGSTRRCRRRASRALALALALALVVAAAAGGATTSIRETALGGKRRSVEGRKTGRKESKKVCSDREVKRWAGVRVDLPVDRRGRRRRRRRRRRQVHPSYSVAVAYQQRRPGPRSSPSGQDRAGRMKGRAGQELAVRPGDDGRSGRAEDGGKSRIRHLVDLKFFRDDRQGKGKNYNKTTKQTGPGMEEALDRSLIDDGRWWWWWWWWWCRPGPRRQRRIRSVDDRQYDDDDDDGDDDDRRS